MNAPTFATLGTSTGNIDVRLSYKIVELFSEGLYASSNKAIEELVANSFDAGAQIVQVLLSSDLHADDASIAIIDDGTGMDAVGLKQHWLIGISNKRKLSVTPGNRQQIGKFGIGKLATYVLANRLTHITKCDGKYYSTSMDFAAIDTRVEKEVEPKSPIKIPLRELTLAQAKSAVSQWTDRDEFKQAKHPLFGTGAAKSWTVAILSGLKPKVHEIRLGMLEWVLRTAIPLRPDFEVYLNGTKLVPSKQGKGVLRTWVLGKDLVDLTKPAPKGITAATDSKVPKTSEKYHGLVVPDLGRVTGFIETYKDLLTGKSDEIGRSHGFFVFVRGRLVNVADGHFGISPDELRHGTFGRCRVVVHMDGLDAALRSNRETVSEGPLLTTAQNVLRAIFNAVRSDIEAHAEGEEPGAALARRLAASPPSISRRPIVELARAVLDSKIKSRYLRVPTALDSAGKAALMTDLEKRAASDSFVTGRAIDYKGKPEDGIAAYDSVTGVLHLNAWHPFVATFHDEFAGKSSGQPLELLAMAEVLAEAQLYAIGVKPDQLDEFLGTRDLLLRNLANESGRKGAHGVALDLLNARNDSSALEDKLCAAFASLGFEVTPIGGSNEPDGVAQAHLAADGKGHPQRYGVTLEAKSKKKDEGKVSARAVNVSAVARQRDKYECEHAVVVGRDFPGGEDSALAIEIDDDRTGAAAKGAEKTITLVTIDTLAELVRLRPRKHLGLRQLREVFRKCRLPSESRAWVDTLRAAEVKKPPYKKIVNAIAGHSKKFKKAAVKYSALRVELSHLSPPVVYDTDEELAELCKAMAQMAPGAIYASPESVELDQSVENVLDAIDAALMDHPPEQP